jgi:hypothetical protein
MKCLVAVLCLVITAGAARACDLCSVYASVEAKESRPGVFVGVAEQFSHFATLREDGAEVPNGLDQYLDSSITQLILGYQFNNRVGVQLNAPVVHRAFRRSEEGVAVAGSESGLGDVALVAHVRVIEWLRDDAMVIASALGGVKFPTGDSGRLREETEEEHHDEEEDHVESGVHGHDLALGSGSVDGIVGGSVFARWKRLFASATVQYAIRSEGDFDYRFANDLMWSGGPGVYLWLAHAGTATLQLNVTGETKGKDTFQGAAADDTGITAVYLGPEVAVTWGDRLSGDVGVDLPVVQNNTALQIVPDYRVRAAVTCRF